MLASEPEYQWASFFVVATRLPGDSSEDPRQHVSPSQTAAMPLIHTHKSSPSPANGQLCVSVRWPCLEDIMTDRSINVINHVQTLQASGEESCHTRFLTFDIFTTQLFDKTHYPPTACSLLCAADSQINPSTVFMKLTDMTRNSHLGNNNDSRK